MTDQRPGSPYTPAAGDAALRQAGAKPLEAADPGRIGPYVPLGLLGSGGMGRVYLARPADDSPGLAAVKVIRPEYAEDPEFRRRFEREAAVQARVHTPHAPQLLGTGFDDSLLWMATQYLPGLNLADAVRECGGLGSAGLWRLVAELGQALSALAAAGVVHRDLKPSNVILSLRHAHVIDFGISQAADASSITTTGSRVGTPAFMSPEYLREGRCDTASDVFSLAGTLIYAATGTAPFGDGTGVDVMHRVAFEEPKAEIMAELTVVDPELAAFLSACLAKDPAGRPTPRQLIDAAAAAGHGHAPSWQEPLGGHLLSRQQACEVLERASARQTGHFRAPTEPVASPAPRPAFGPATPPSPYGAPPTPPGPYGTPSTPPAAYGMATPPAHYGTSPQGPPSVGNGASGTRRSGRKPYLAVAAGVAVVAVIVSAFLLTRPEFDETASASPTTSGSTASDNEPGSVSPSPSSSPSSREKEKEKEEGKEKEKGESEGQGEDEQATGGAADGSGGSSGGGTGGAQPTVTVTATSGSGTAGGTGTSPTETATTPAEPPWNTQCTYYSGTALTRYGDKNSRVTQVQCMLVKRGYSVGNAGVDGQFGDGTRAAVKKFQSAKGLDVDGIVGANTWGALRSST
ncbi:MULTISPECIES: serine/threonine-protein kinase [Streptomyces]|uniref:serine/threonine-protein kinase n=1 Tax=Streptomyces TaxID=1883 RepID=UPI001489F0D6|nr:MULTISPECIES: serine/threonine-protein kinase [Streptomyces]